MTILSPVKLSAYSVTVVRFVMSGLNKQLEWAEGGRGDHDNVTRAGRRGGCLIMGKINFSNSGLKSVSNLIK